MIAQQNQSANHSPTT